MHNNMYVYENAGDLVAKEITISLSYIDWCCGIRSPISAKVQKAQSSENRAEGHCNEHWWIS